MKKIALLLFLSAFALLADVTGHGFGRVSQGRAEWQAGEGCGRR
jgi:hypothetical protein